MGNRCQQTHQFGDDPLGHRRQCDLLDEEHLTPGMHLTSDGRWWSVSASQPQSAPTTTTTIVDLLRADIDERERVGLERYGVRLEAHNGKDALREAYEEALDLAIYLRQALRERDGR